MEEGVSLSRSTTGCFREGKECEGTSRLSGLALMAFLRFYALMLLLTPSLCTKSLRSSNAWRRSR